MMVAVGQADGLLIILISIADEFIRLGDGAL